MSQRRRQRLKTPLAAAGGTDDHRIDTALVTTEQCLTMLETLEDELGSAAWGHWVRAEQPAAGNGASEIEAQEHPLDKRTQQAGNAVSLVHAAKIIADRLELGSAGDELALSEVLSAAETAVNELFGEIHAAAEAVATKSDDS